MEDQDSLLQRKVLSRSSKGIHKLRDARNAVLELFFGQGQRILSEIESEQVHSVLENKNLCALSPNFLSSPKPPHLEEQMSGWLQPPARLKGPCSQRSIWELRISCSKVPPCTESLTFPSSLRCTTSRER